MRNSIRIRVGVDHLECEPGDQRPGSRSAVQCRYRVERGSGVNNSESSRVLALVIFRQRVLRGHGRARRWDQSPVKNVRELHADLEIVALFNAKIAAQIGVFEWPPPGTENGIKRPHGLPDLSGR